MVRAVVFATIAVSLFHFTDNAINIDDYPKAGWQPGWFDIVVVAGWFLYTGVGLAGYRFYQQGRFGAAHVALILYGYLILSSLGHFIYGPPSELHHPRRRFGVRRRRGGSGGYRCRAVVAASAARSPSSDSVSTFRYQRLVNTTLTIWPRTELGSSPSSTSAKVSSPASVSNQCE